MWLKANYVREAIEIASEKIVDKVNFEELTDKLVQKFYDRCIEPIGLYGDIYYTVKNRLTEKVVQRYEAEVLKKMNSKEIIKLVESGIKEKVKDSLK